MSVAKPERLAIRQGDKESTVWMGSGLLASADAYLASRSGRFLLFSSPAAATTVEALRHALGSRVLIDRSVDDREASKTLEGAGRVVDQALAAGVRRDDALVAVGGGVTTDLVGFAAAILLRGVEWNAVPTTTAGMADAAVGGKTGVNHGLGKNLLGAFHPPSVVLADPSAVSTLPERDYRAGLVEACKAAWIADVALAERLAEELPAILERREKSLLSLLSGAIRVKASIVAGDPRDFGRRHLLNFGHTLGHALEAAGDFTALRHGEAVAWGIAAALEISRRRAGLSEADARSIRATLARLGPFPAPVRDSARLRPLLEHDKKATAAGAAAVLLESVGVARVEKSVTAEEWLEAAAIMTLS